MQDSSILTCNQFLSQIPLSFSKKRDFAKNEHFICSLKNPAKSGFFKNSICNLLRDFDILTLVSCEST
jgi:hypothetical protein